VAIVPVENSLEGSVGSTLDSLWQYGHTLAIQQALILPIEHQLVTNLGDLSQIERVYSHPQALGQCQGWLEAHLPRAERIATHSTTEVLGHLDSLPQGAAIASRRAAQLYNLPILAGPIGDQPDNRTRFLVLGPQSTHQGRYTSLAFTLPANVPGALLAPLEVVARCHINLSRIESRPTKRSLGEYLFFLDLEADASSPLVARALQELAACVETIKSFGSYDVMAID
jgi:prephenate dehydratase